MNWDWGTILFPNVPNKHLEKTKKNQFTVHQPFLRNGKFAFNEKRIKLNYFSVKLYPVAIESNLMVQIKLRLFTKSVVSSKKKTFLWKLEFEGLPHSSFCVVTISCKLMKIV